MAGRVSVECPGCLAKLNLSDSSKLGKKIKCPKCSDVFVAKAGDEDEDLDDLDEDEAPAKSAGGKKRPAPAGRKGAPTKGGHGKGKSSGGNNGPLIAVGAVAVVVLIGAGLFLSGIFGGNPPLPAPVVEQAPMAPPVAVAAAPAPNPAERILGLRWLPKETEMLIHAKISDLWQAPLLKAAIEMPFMAEGVKELQKATGLTPSDIESLTIGMADLQGMQGMVASQMMGFPAQRATPKVIAVVRTKKPVSLDEILKASQEIKAADYNSKKYFENTTGEPFAGWVADSKTVLMGPPTELKAVMDRGETVTPRKELLFMDATPHVVMIVAPKDPKSLNGGMEPPTFPGIPPETDVMLKTLNNSQSGFGLGINIRGGIDVKTSWMLTDADSVTKVKAGLDAGIVELRKQLESFKATGQPLLAELCELLMNNLKVETQKQIVTISTNVPDSDQQKLEQVPAVLMVMMAMSGGIGGGPSLFSPGGMNTRGGTPSFPSTLESGPKRPGETDPVSAEVADGVPDGTTLTACTAWGAPTFNAERKPSYPIQIILDLKGDAANRICSGGQVTIKNLKLKGGGPLTASKTDSQGHPSITKVLVANDEPGQETAAHPEGTMRLAFNVDPPADASTPIESFEGTFTFMTADDSEEFPIENAAKTAKRPLGDPSLKAAGAKLLLSPAADSLTLSCAKGFYVGTVNVTFPDTQNSTGLPTTFYSEIEKNHPVQKLMASSVGGKFPEGMQIQFKIYREVKESTVSFKFADIPLPSLDSQPQPPNTGPPPFGGTMPPGMQPSMGQMPPPMASAQPNGPMPQGGAHGQAQSSPMPMPMPTPMPMPNSGHGQGGASQPNGSAQANGAHGQGRPQSSPMPMPMPTPKAGHGQGSTPQSNAGSSKP